MRRLGAPARALARPRPAGRHARHNSTQPGDGSAGNMGKAAAAVGVLGLGAAAGVYYVKNQRAAAPDPMSEQQQADLAKIKAAAEAKKAAQAEAAAASAKERAAAKEREAAASAAKEQEAEKRREALLVELKAVVAKVEGPGAASRLGVEEGMLALKSCLAKAAEEGMGSVGEVVSAQGRLSELETVQQSRTAVEEARGALHDAVTAQDAPAARKALEELAGAERALRDLEEEPAADQANLAWAYSFLANADRLEEEAKCREAALATLQEAVDARDPTRCAEARAAAIAAGIQGGALLEVAAILAEPQKMHAALAKEGMQNLGELRRIYQEHAINPRDYAAAAAVAATGMSEELLRKQAAELASAILRNHAFHSREFEMELRKSEGKLLKGCSERVEETVSAFRQEMGRLDGQARSELAMALWARAEEEVLQGTAEVNVQAASRRQAWGEAAAEAMAEGVSRERAGAEQRLGELHAPLNAINELVQSGQSLQHRSQAFQKLSKALLALEGAMVEGRAPARELQALREAGGEGSFVAQILGQLPKDAVARMKEPVPSEPQLRRSFAEQLNDFKAAALTPPSEGIVGGLWAAAVGRLLGRLYSLKGPADSPKSAGTPSEAARANLAALAKANQYLENGALLPALSSLEALTGGCRARAESWMAGARQALLLQQAARAVQAKARCLNAVLL